MNVQIKLKMTGILMLTASILLSVGYSLFREQIVDMMRLHISLDQQVTTHGEQTLTTTVFGVMILLFVLGLGLLKAQNIAWRTKVKQVLLTDPVAYPALPGLSPQFILVVSSLIGLFLIVTIRISERFPTTFAMLYREDGVFESSTPIALIISVGLLGITVWRLLKEPTRSKSHRYLPAIYLFLMGLFFFYAMEEISWGQRILGWRTPDIFAKNVQHETNLHNFFNPYFRYFYWAPVLLLIGVLISIWLEVQRRGLDWSRLVLPHPSLVGLSLQITFVATVWHEAQELLEELVAVFILFYSFRLYSYFSTKGNGIKT